MLLQDPHVGWAQGGLAGFPTSSTSFRNIGCMDQLAWRDEGGDNVTGSDRSLPSIATLIVAVSDSVGGRWGGLAFQNLRSPSETVGCWEQLVLGG